jgi:hypothetical protein
VTGGFWWQLMDSKGLQLMPSSIIQAHNGHPSKTQRGPGCLSKLRQLCVPQPPSWKQFQLYDISNGGSGVSPQNFTDFTAEFMLTRGPFAMLGYGWSGCTDGEQTRPRATEWDTEYGQPVNGAACAETGEDTGIFRREWTAATVEWDCASGHGKISPKL